ncbi:hypothetical protein ZOSMA_101G00360 [Zostera marina]|uniref:Uncharacterized protein n=1 Tax=Zostera marina TaxID=29655 RepID=A0A0K9Q6D4_ZOSMR|nr:hypothetical protein ZOSMA_101G00360 [Zostera marina]
MDNTLFHALLMALLRFGTTKLKKRSSIPSRYRFSKFYLKKKNCLSHPLALTRNHGYTIDIDNKTRDPQ